jgi:sugar phosphate isomerase/epimerase
MPPTDAPQLKATCTSWSWSLLPFEKVAQIMSLLGFRAIDVGAFAGWAHYEPSVLAARPEAMAREIGAVAERYEMSLSDLIVTFGPGLVERCVNYPDRAVRDANLETFKRLTEFCRHASIPGITLCPGAEHKSLGRAASLQLAMDELARLAEVGHQAGLRVSFEPHVESITESPEDALRVVRQVHHLTLTLDYSHFSYLGYSDQEIEPLIPYAGHFHMRQAKKGTLQCRTSEGQIDFERALTRLRECRYDGWLAFEYVWEQWLDNDRVDVLSETLMLRRQLARFFNAGDCMGVVTK